MTERTQQQPPQRVRVTGPPRRTAPPARRRTEDIDEETALGAVYLGSLLRAQLGLAARVLAVLAVTVGSLPLLFHVFPGLDDIGVLGMPLPWLLLAVLVYPWLVVLGWRFVRAAEHYERDFVDLLAEAEADE